MADIDNFRLDEIDFGDYGDYDMDFGDLDNGINPNDRNPISDAKKGFIKTAKSNLQSRNFFLRTLRKAIPKNYRRLWDLKDATEAQGTVLYNKAAERAAPGIKTAKKNLNKHLDKLEGKIPPKLLEKIRNATEVNEYKSRSTSAEREDEIKNVLSETFSTTVAQNEANRKETRAIAEFTETNSERRHGESVLFLSAISKTNKALVAYNNEINYKVQKQGLELSLRKLFVLRDILSATQESQQKLGTKLDAVVKNTALPDALKYKTDELMAYVAKQNIFGRITNGMTGNLDNVVANITKHIGEKTSNFFGALSDSYQMYDSLSDIGPSDSLGTKAGQFVGGVATEKLSDLAAGQLSKRFAKHRGLQRINTSLGLHLANAVNYGRDFISGRGNFKDLNGNSDFKVVNGELVEKGLLDRLVGSGADLLRAGISGLDSKDSLTVKTSGMNIDEPAQITNRVTNSITTVIPELLSMIEFGVRKLNNESGERLRYDHAKFEFVTKGTAKDRTLDRIVSAYNPGGVRRDVNEVIDTLDNRKQLSTKQRDALSRQLMYNSREGISMSSVNYTDERSFNAIKDPEIVKSLVDFFSKNYGRVKGFEGGEGAKNRLQTAANIYNNLTENVKEVLDTIENLWKLGNEDELRQLGFLIEGKNGYEFNFDKIVDLTLTHAPKAKDVEEAKHSPLGSYIGKGIAKNIQSLKERGSRIRERYKGKSAKEIGDDIKDQSSIIFNENIEKLKAIDISKYTEHKNVGRVKDKLSELKDTLSNLTQPIIDNDIVQRVKSVVSSKSLAAKKAVVNYVAEVQELLEAGGFKTAAGKPVKDIKELSEKVYNDITQEYIDPVVVTTTIDDILSRVKQAPEEIKQATRAKTESATKAIEDTLGVKVNTFNPTSRGEGSTVDLSSINPSLERLINLTEAGLATKQEMLEVLKTIGMHSNGEPSKAEKVYSRFNKSKELAKAAFKAPFRFLGKTVGASWNLTWKGMGGLGAGMLGAGMAVMGAGFRTAKWLFSDDLRDIYVKGESEPALRAKHLREGRYIDKDSGKVVKTEKDLKGIKGPVIDVKTQEVVLTKEEMDKGLFVMNPEGSFSKLGHTLMTGIGLTWQPAILLMKGASKLISTVTDTLFRTPDIYLAKNLKEVRLYGRMIDSGAYYSASTGKPIKSLKDIDSDVLDADGEVILGIQEIHKGGGLVDKYGKPVETLGFKLASTLVGLPLRMAGAVIKGTLKASYKTLDFLGKGIGGILGRVGRALMPKYESQEEASIVGIATTNALLSSILSMLDDRLPGKRKFGDKDGDGIRDGSAEDILKARKKAAEEAKEGKGKEKEEGTSIFSKLRNLFSFGGKSDDDGEDGDGDTTIIGGLGGDGADGKDKKKGKNKGKKPRGRIGRGVDALKRGTGWLGNKLGGVAKSPVGRAVAGQGSRLLGRMAVTGAIGAGAGMLLGGAGAAGVLGAAGAALALLASPVVGIGLAVGGLAYAGVKLYQALKANDFLRLRMNQYGLDTESHEDAIRIVLRLEKLFEDNLVRNPKGYSIDLDSRKLAEFLIDIGLPDKYKETFAIWVSQRMRPIFLQYHMAKDSVSVDQNGSLDQIDASGFTDTRRFKVATKVCNKFSSLYSISQNPFLVNGITYLTGRDIMALEEEILSKYSEKSKKEEKKSQSVSMMGADSVSPFATPINTESKPTIKAAGNTLSVNGGGIADGEDKNKRITTNASISVQNTGAILKSKEISIMDRIRAKAYGVSTLVKSRIETLLDLEREVANHVSYSAKGDAKYNLTDEATIEYFGKFFNVGPNDDSAITFVRWFKLRFLPAFLKYSSAVYYISPKLDFVATFSSLSGEQMSKIANAVISATSGGWLFGKSIWSITDVPWTDMPPNVDRSSVSGELDALNKIGSKAVLSEMMTDLSAQVAKDAGLKDVIKTKTPSFYEMITGEKSEKDKERESRQSTGREGDRRSQVGAQTSSSRFSSGSYLMPTTGRISSEFSKDRKHPVTGQVRPHNGIDIAAPEGTPIYAANDGVIAVRAFLNGYGNAIYIDHPDGSQTRYGHMSKFQPGLAVGSNVQKGDLIGYVGNTGISSGPHLHFEIRKKSGSTATPVDPLPYLSSEVAQEVKKEIETQKNSAKEVEEEAKAAEADPIPLEGMNTITTPSTKTLMGTLPTNTPSSDASKVKEQAVQKVVASDYNNDEASRYMQVSKRKSTDAKQQQSTISPQPTSVLPSFDDKIFKDLNNVNKDSNKELREINKGIRDLANIMASMVDANSKTPYSTPSTGRSNVMQFKK